jgi:hypothetical protein
MILAGTGSGTEKRRTIFAEEKNTTEKTQTH